MYCVSTVLNIDTLFSETRIKMIPYIRICLGTSMYESFKRKFGNHENKKYYTFGHSPH